MIWTILTAASFAGASWWWARRTYSDGYRRGYEHGALAMKHHIFEQMGFVSAEDQD